MREPQTRIEPTQDRLRPDPVIEQHIGCSTGRPHRADGWARAEATWNKIVPKGLNLSIRALRQGGWMFAATVISGGLSYLANATVGRLLDPPDYSVYTSMLSLTLMLGGVASVIQTVTTNSVARLRAADSLRLAGETQQALGTHNRAVEFLGRAVSTRPQDHCSPSFAGP